MATAPEFTATPNKGTPASLTAANTSKDGTGATGRALVFTASTGKGSLLPSIRCHPKGANVATLIRVFKNNGSDPEVASNNILIRERAIATSALSEAAENAIYDIALNLVLKGDASTPERVYVTLATGVATGVAITPMNGGDF
jgi:hypothetical protein